MVHSPQQGTSSTREIRDQSHGMIVSYDWTDSSELVLRSTGRSPSCNYMATTNINTTTSTPVKGSSWSYMNHIWLLHGIDTMNMDMNDFTIGQRISHATKPVIMIRPTPTLLLLTRAGTCRLIDMSINKIVTIVRIGTFNN
jgi:hypothetical protein